MKLQEDILNEIRAMSEEIKRLEKAIKERYKELSYLYRINPDPLEKPIIYKGASNDLKATFNIVSTNNKNNQ